MDQLRIRFIGVHQPDFQVDEAGQAYQRSIKGLEVMGRELGFLVRASAKPIMTEAELAPLLAEIQAERPDLLLVQNSSFAPGHLIPPLARMGLKLGLWAVPEPRETGGLPLNSFCGMNMYGSIIRQYMREEKIKYKWFFGFPGDPAFDARLGVTVRALRVLKKLAGATIGLVGGIAPGFDDFYFDERTVQARFGVKINRLLEFDDLEKAAAALPERAVEEALAEIKSEGKNLDLADEDLAAQARVYLSVKELAARHKLDAVALSCWPKYNEITRVAPCSAIGRLNEHGITVSCEGDLPGALAMYILNCLNDSQATLMDMVAYDERDDSVLMWHCGPSAKRWACDGRLCYRRDSITKLGTVNDFVLKSSEVTVLQLADDCRQGLVFTGRTLAKPAHDGCRGWIGDLRRGKRDLPALDLVNTVMVKGLPHHYALGEGFYEREIMEVFSWLGVRPIEPVEQGEYMQNPDN